MKSFYLDSFFFILVIRSFKISLDYVFICNTVLLTLTVHLVHYIPRSYHYITESLNILATLTHFTHLPPLPLATTNLFFVYMS